MPVNEEIRHQVYAAFKSTYGATMAGSIMEMLPPAGVPELATKADVEMLRAELTGVRDNLRAEIAGVDRGLRVELTGVDRGLRVEMTSLEARLGERIEAGLRQQHQAYTRLMLTAIALTGTLAGTLGGFVARLG